MGQNVGFDGSVFEARAVVRFSRLHGKDLIPDAFRPVLVLVSGWTGFPAAGDVHLADIRGAVAVIAFVKADAGGHVEDLLQRGARPGGVRQFR